MLTSLELFGRTELEREANAEKYMTSSQLIMHEKINIVLNVIAAFVICILFNCNLIFLGIFFILFDIVMGFIDNYIFSIRIYYEYREDISIEEREKRVKKLKQRYEKKLEEFKRYEERHCINCGAHNSYEKKGSLDVCGAIKPCSFMEELKKLKKDYTKANSKYEEEVEKLKEQELIKEDKRSKDYVDKIEYFKDVKAIVKVFKADKQLGSLKIIFKSLGQLIEILEKKPIGYTLIPNTLYIYLDELCSILNKFSSLESVRKETYVEQIDKVSNALSENIERLTKRIQNFEENDIDVGLSVLLQELVKENSESEEKKDV